MECYYYPSLAVSLALLLSFIKLILASPSANKKQLPPSPPSLPIAGHLHLLRKPLHRSLARVSSAHGPVVLLYLGSRPALIVSSLSAAEECFTKNEAAFATRPRLPSMKSLTYNFTTLSFAPYGPHWRNVRRVATVELLSSARLHSLSYIRRSEVDSLILNLFKEGWSGAEDRRGRAGHGRVDPEMEAPPAPPQNEDDLEFKEVELKPRLFGLAFNVMMRMIAGKRYGDEQSEEARRFREMVDETVAMSDASNTSDFLPVLRWMDLGGLKKRLSRVEKKKDVTLQGLIDEKRNGEVIIKTKEKKSILEVLLSMQEENPEYYTDEIVKATITSLFFGGTDTSTDTTEWAMTLIVNHPQTLQKARKEIDSLTETSRLLQEDDLPNLPYLQAILNETLRLCPAVPLLLPHESLDECSVGGYHIPRGTMLLVNAWAIHRDPEVWEDPLEFKPERFLGGREDGCRIIPFGMGRRKCPGYGLATRVVGLVLGSLIQCFEWERIGEELVDMDERGGLTLHKINPLRLKYRPRPNMMDVISQLRSI